MQCVHKGIMDHFGENPDSFMCVTMCSNCRERGLFQITDGTLDAQKVVQAAIELSDVEVTYARSNQKGVSHLQGYRTFGILQKRFSSLTLIGKFLQILIKMGILSNKISKKGSKGNVSVGPKPHPHDLLGDKITVTKYEKTYNVFSNS